MAKYDMTVTKVTCDNENCPGTELNEKDPHGWLFVTVEFYGEPTLDQLVFCSPSCVAAGIITSAGDIAKPAPEDN